MTDPRAFAAPNPAAERHAAATPEAGATNASLWFAVFAPPVAWSADELASIALHHDYCAALLGRTFVAWRGVGVMLVVAGLVCLAVALWGGLVAWRARATLGDDTGRGDTDLDRRRFMAHAGLVTCGLFSFGIVLRLVTVLFVSPDHCGS